MRFNEDYGLPITFLYPGQVDGAMGEELEKHGISYHGYIVLESQVEDKNKIRGDDHKIIRKPLKGHKIIHPRNFRTIPITEKECWNVLVRRFKKQQNLYEEKAFGLNKIDYMLFEELSRTKANGTLKKIYEENDFVRKSFHDCRHTFCTYFVGRTKSFFLARAILGHKGSDAFERYLHIYEHIALKAKQNKAEIEFVS